MTSQVAAKLLVDDWNFNCPDVRILIKFLLANQKNLNDRGCKHFALFVGCVSRIADEKNAARYDRFVFRIATVDPLKLEKIHYKPL